MHKVFRNKAFAGLLWLFMVVSWQAPAAAEPNGTAALQGGSEGISGDASSASPSLKGGVQKVELSLEKLRDVGLDLKHMLTAASHLYEEVTLQPVSIVTQPEVVGPGIIINIPIGTQPAGPPIPARKDHVDLAMAQITPVINMMKQHVDDFVDGRAELEMPAEELTKLKPMLDNWVTLVNALAVQSQNLQPLTAAPPYNNQDIAGLTLAMQKNVKKLDEVRRKIYKVIAKEGKRRVAKSN